MTQEQIKALSDAELDKAIVERLGFKFLSKPYSTNIQFAFDLLETMRGRGWHYQIIGYVNNATECFLVHSLHQPSRQVAGTATRAIAEACLMALIEESNAE